MLRSKQFFHFIFLIECSSNFNRQIPGKKNKFYYYTVLRDRNNFCATQYSTDARCKYLRI